MSYIKCISCPTREGCDEHDACLNTRVIMIRQWPSPVSIREDGTRVHNVPPVQPEPARHAAQGTVPGGSSPRVVARPAAGTATGRVWAICDKLRQTGLYNGTDLRRAVVAECEAVGLNPTTAGVQYGHWRKAVLSHQ